jgi:ADP-heptose:LPS heptosyltransferase
MILLATLPLAAALAIPTITLFGPTNPATWQPVGPKVHTLVNPQLADLPIGDVLATTLRAIG